MPIHRSPIAMGGSAKLFIPRPAVAVASYPVPFFKDRHLDRSCSQSHREQRSGEAPAFSSSSHGHVDIIAAVEDRKPNPKQLVLWAIAGAFLAASVCLISVLPIPQLPANGSGFWDVAWMNRLRFAALSAPLAIGITVSLLAVRRFKRGFYDNIWSEAELEPVKALVTNPIWTWASVILIAPPLLSIILNKNLAHTGAGGFICLALLPTQTAQHIRQLLTPKEKSIGALADWQNSKPISSGHWGQPPVHPSK
jgi:hypothetical protein